MARLNIQGLARRDPMLMTTLLAPPGETIVSVDLAAGEPSCISHFSGDERYYQATFGMVGKEPYYQDGILMIDDIYLMGMSVSPMGRDLMWQTFHRPDFIKQWMEDKEVVQKKWLKKERAFHKILILGLGYGMGPKGMVTNAYDNGYSLTLTQARAFYAAYWELFDDVRRLADTLATKVKKDGYLRNVFGYTLWPQPHKGFNYFIQSSVSGIMKVLTLKFLTACPYAKYITTIHDELLFSVPTEKLSEAQEILKSAEESLNRDLNWSVNIRCGWAPGKNMFEAK